MRITQIQHICKLFYSYASNADVKKILALAEKVGWNVDYYGYSEIGGMFIYDFSSDNKKIKGFRLKAIAKAEGYSDPEKALFSGKLHVDQIELQRIFANSNCKFNYNFGSKSVLFPLLLVVPLLFNYVKSIKIKGKRIEFDYTLSYYSYIQFLLKWPRRNKLRIEMEENEKSKVCSFWVLRSGLKDYEQRFTIDNSYNFLLGLDNEIDKVLEMIKNDQAN